jgi:NADH:ubiquinone oxidoreductase subunit 5 (subunit L)/multisubunit Na+/H+ antiporter MnhA subunit
MRRQARRCQDYVTCSPPAPGCRHHCHADVRLGLSQSRGCPAAVAPSIPVWNKWWFDELYDYLWVKPTFVISRFISGIDKNWIDVFLDSLARFVAWFARVWEFLADQIVVDGFVNVFAGWTYNLGVTLRQVQTGRIRQYVMFIVLGAIAVFVVVFLFWSPLVTAQH